MALPKTGQDRFTFDLPLDLRGQLNQLAAARGQSAGECLRRILAEKLTQLQQQEEATP